MIRFNIPRFNYTESTRNSKWEQRSLLWPLLLGRTWTPSLLSSAQWDCWNSCCFFSHHLNSFQALTLGLIYQQCSGEESPKILDLLLTSLLSGMLAFQVLDVLVDHKCSFASQSFGIAGSLPRSVTLSSLPLLNFSASLHRLRMGTFPEGKCGMQK